MSFDTAAIVIYIRRWCCHMMSLSHIHCSPGALIRHYREVVLEAINTARQRACQRDIMVNMLLAENASYLRRQLCWQPGGTCFLQATTLRENNIIRHFACIPTYARRIYSWASLRPGTPLLRLHIGISPEGLPLLDTPAPFGIGCHALPLLSSPAVYAAIVAGLFVTRLNITSSILRHVIAINLFMLLFEGC
jgi:hypothetical protein